MRRDAGLPSVSTAALVAMLGLVLGTPLASADTKSFDASWLGYDPSRSSSAAAELEAQLMRRAGGEWVIVSLGPRVPETPQTPLPPAAPAADTPRSTASVTDYIGVQATLREYERALEKRDAALLARVWIMNPSELAQFEWLFGESAAISVSIDDSDIEIDGDRASMRFAQTFVVSRRSPHFGRRSSRSLVARDAAGSWELDTILDQE